MALTRYLGDYVRGVETRQTGARTQGASTALQSGARLMPGRDGAPVTGWTPFDRTAIDGGADEEEANVYGAQLYPSHASGDPIDIAVAPVHQIGVTGFPHVVPLFAGGSGGRRIVTAQLLIHPAADGSASAGLDVRFTIPSGTISVAASIGAFLETEDGFDLRSLTIPCHAIRTTWDEWANHWFFYY
ncbi:hypothetical protein U5903_04175 [Cereibacter johrii]|uniref:hypothetical protein n=1 Tax=Cereibacter johrii TaxID=445629 RepID=UPI002B25C89B|nr:hypothetical protein [Cereibacter johrii]MEA5159965.1 hypothetical protein [Cereibacter johrii]